MQIKHIYEKYQIMPQLATHMQRVAGVGQLILDGWRGEIDRNLVMRALLLHDMGNIVKFDLSEEGQKKFMSIDSGSLEYWRGLQKKFWEKYGKNTHEVTKQIIAELGQDDVNEVMDQEHRGYLSGDTSQILRQDYPAKILAYCDVRVTPQGVVPMRERIADLSKRYGKDLPWYDFLYDLEMEIRDMTTADLGSITNEAVEPYLDKLLTYTI